MTKRIVRFDENGGEYIGFLVVTSHELSFDCAFPKRFIADGVIIEIDENIIDISEVTTENKSE